MFPEAATTLLNSSGVPRWRKDSKVLFQQREASSTSEVFKSHVRGKTHILFIMENRLPS